MTLMDWRVVKPELIIIIIIIKFSYGVWGGQMETNLRLESCDHVEKMIDQMKATDLDAGEQGERFLIYMYVTCSDDSGNDTVEQGSSSDTLIE